MLVIMQAEAIAWAWELLTTVYKLDSSRLYATYFGGDPSQGLEPDEEARQIWCGSQADRLSSGRCCQCRSTG